LQNIVATEQEKQSQDNITLFEKDNYAQKIKVIELGE